MTLAELLKHLNHLAEEKPESLDWQMKTNDYEFGGYFKVSSITEDCEGAANPKKILVIS